MHGVAAGRRQHGLSVSWIGWIAAVDSLVTPVDLIRTPVNFPLKKNHAWQWSYPTFGGFDPKRDVCEHVSPTVDASRARRCMR